MKRYLIIALFAIGTVAGYGSAICGWASGHQGRHCACPWSEHTMDRPGH
jgi:hypothetical protein